MAPFCPGRAARAGRWPLGSMPAATLTVFLTVLRGVGVGGLFVFLMARTQLCPLSATVVWKGTSLGFGRTRMSSRLPLIICFERGQSISFVWALCFLLKGWDGIQRANSNTFRDKAGHPGVKWPGGDSAKVPRVCLSERHSPTQKRFRVVVGAFGTGPLV